MVFREREISRYIFLHILFMFILISLTIVNGLKIKNILFFKHFATVTFANNETIIAIV